MEVKGLLMVKFCIFSETGYWKHTCEKIYPSELDFFVSCPSTDECDPHTTSLAEISSSEPCDHALSLWLFWFHQIRMIEININIISKEQIGWSSYIRVRTWRFQCSGFKLFRSYKLSIPSQNLYQVIDLAGCFITWFTV